MEPPAARHLGEIVVIDDTPANLRLLAELLGGHGHQVRPFPSGKLALAGIEHCNANLVLLDIQMPEMDGYEVCKRLKAQEHTRDIPVIFISALHESLDKTKAFSMGGVDYITKPFEMKEVLARVTTHVNLYHFQQQLKNQNMVQASQLAEQNQQLRQVNQALQAQHDWVQATQLRLVQTEKLASLGGLVAGIAHEINNPLGFISGNLQAAQEHIADLLAAFELYQDAQIKLDSDRSDRLEELDVEFVIEDLPRLLQSMRKGVDTIKNISDALRTFSRSENTQKTSLFDLHSGLDSTVMMLRYRLKANENRPNIEVVKDYGDIPEVECYPGKLNQVFMNVIANAIDAFAEQNAGLSYREIQNKPNQITIRTGLTDSQQVKIEIQDNGPGIPEALQAQIFEQGFTTKEVGKGTGLGMAIARQIVETDHGGTIRLQSVVGSGSTFTLLLPTQAIAVTE